MLSLYIYIFIYTHCILPFFARLNKVDNIFFICIKLKLNDYVSTRKLKGLQYTVTCVQSCFMKHITTNENNSKIAFCCCVSKIFILFNRKFRSDFIHVYIHKTLKPNRLTTINTQNKQKSVCFIKHGLQNISKKKVEQILCRVYSPASPLAII